MNDFIINQEKFLKYNFRSRMVLRSPWLNFITTARFQDFTKLVTLYIEMTIDAFPGKESLCFPHCVQSLLKTGRICDHCPIF